MIRLIQWLSTVLLRCAAARACGGLEDDTVGYAASGSSAPLSTSPASPVLGRLETKYACGRADMSTMETPLHQSGTNVAHFKVQVRNIKNSS